MMGLLGSLIGSQGGRMLGGAIGGRTGAMIGSFAGSMVVGRQGGNLIRGAKGKLADLKGGDQDDQGGQELTDRDAEVLIRSMVNAAKADGSIDQSEIDAIMGELGEITHEEQKFLQSELSGPFLPAEGVGQQVPESLRVEAYVVTLMSITLDTDDEANYLQALADSMGIDETERHEIHDQFKIPRIG